MINIAKYLLAAITAAVVIGLVVVIIPAIPGGGWY
jgi:hypothetical protein